MTKYLSLNGTNSYIQLPMMTIKKFTIDAVFYMQSADLRMILDAQTGLTNGYVYGRTSGSLITAGGVFAVTNYAWDTRKVVDFTATKNGDVNGNFTDDVTLFANKSFGENFKALVYDIKCYNAANNLVAHYDMSTGTLQDQSGNGNHATLVGGTWVDNSAGTNTTVNYSLNQSILANRTTSSTIKQAVFSNEQLNANLTQSYFTDRNDSLKMSIAQYKSGTSNFDTLQNLFNESVQRIEQYLIEVSIYRNSLQYFTLKQRVADAISSYYSTNQTVFGKRANSAQSHQIIFNELQELAGLSVEFFAETTDSYELLIGLLDDFSEYREVVRFILELAKSRHTSMTLTPSQKLNLEILLRKSHELKL